MTASLVMLLFITMGASAYAVLGGADYGAGVWWAVAARRGGDDQRRLLRTSIGPIWEANHVWLIFTVVSLLTAFPPAYSTLSRGLELPIAIALLGIVLRGSGFVFAAAGAGRWAGIFAVASLTTPFAWGDALGEIVDDCAAGGTSRLTAFTRPLPLLTGVLALSVCAYLAAVFTCGDAKRLGLPGLVAVFRRRALGTGVLCGALALAAVPLSAHESPALNETRGAVFILLSALAGSTTLVLLWRQRLTLARLTASFATAAIVWGWAAAQYPVLVPPDLTAEGAAAPAATLRAAVAVTIVGLVLTLPAFVTLMRTFHAPEPSKQ
jgi:cytochrome d ubiquinol oxidase subunit II